MVTWLLACALKAALLLAASWLGAALLRRSSAAARHQIWTLGVVGVLVVPVLCWIVPSLLPVSSASIGSTSLVVPAVIVTGGSATVAAAPAWPAWIAVLWATGAVLVAIRIVRGHVAARRLVRDATRVDDAVAREAARTLGLAKRVPILRSAAIHTPMTVGVLRSRVLLPADADAWSHDRLRAVLLHELGHVKRRDTLVQLAAQLASALYWWNPLAWLAVARLRIEREHACDDLVLGAGTLPSSYATDILDVARSVSAHVHANAICMVDRSSTEARLRRILDASTPRRQRMRSRLAVLTLAGAAVAAIACTSSAPPRSASAQPKRGTLSVGAPFVREPAGETLRPPGLVYETARSTRGELDLSLVSAEVQRRIVGLEQCYERRLATKPALAGAVTIHWVIEPSGNVPEACITQDTVGDPEIVECVNELVLRGGAFPAPRGGAIDVSLPFVFSPRG